VKSFVARPWVEDKPYSQSFNNAKMVSRIAGQVVPHHDKQKASLVWNFAIVVVIEIINTLTCHTQAGEICDNHSVND